MAITAQTKVLTHDYWKTADQLVPGDFIFNKEGKPVEVTLVQHFRSEQCYRIIFDDSLTIEGDKNLGFFAETQKYRDRIGQYKGRHKFRRPLVKINVQTLLDPTNSHSFSIQTVKPLQLAYQDLPVPPFVFGFWFFNRRKNKRMAAPKGRAQKVYEQMADAGYKVKEHRKAGTGEQEFSVKPTIESHLIPFIPRKIPNNYLMASSEQRIELLKGILHSKSRIYSEKQDFFRFTSYNKTVIFQLQWLLESLGHRTRMMYRESLKNYTIFFKSKLPLLENQNSPPLRLFHSRRFIKEVEPIGPQLCVYIETKDPDNGIVVGEGFIACR